jgi:flagellar L-ring protein precursor FlgH
MKQHTSLIAVASLATALLALGGCATTAPEMNRGDESRFSAVYPEYDPAAAASNGAIYSRTSATSLFEDYKARRVGDILTVLLAEETNAQKSNEASTSRDSNIDLLDPTILGRPVTSNGTPILNTEIESSQGFSGQGEAAQSNLLEGSITVTVANVMQNGNLIVQGEKWIRINRGQEYIQLRGIVRPVDISANNTVLSTQVGDADIAYGGTGEIARSSAQGWLTRFFGSALWPL